MNFLDRLISYVAPKVALRRAMDRTAFEAFSGLTSDGAPSSPLNGRWSTTPRSADADIVRGLPRQRSESRELRATNPIAAGAIDTNLQRVVGTGLQPVPSPEASLLGLSPERMTTLKEIISREWSMFADSRECTLDGTQTFYERQELVLGARLESGDCFTLLPDAPRPSPNMPYRLRLQLIEADRCANPYNGINTATQVAGIKLSPQGAPIACHILDRHPGGLPSQSASLLTGQWYDFIGQSGRRIVLHHYRPTRPEQSRGVPYLAPVIQAIKDLGRYTEAEITAAVLSAFYTVFIEQEDGGGNPAPVFGANPEPAQAGAEPDAGATVAMAPGAIIGLARGERAKFADPNRPNTAYEPFVSGVLTLIGAGLGLPVELLLKKFNASYSASKAALLDAWQHFKSERAWLVNSFCQPVYETWFAEAVAIGRIPAPGFFADPVIRWAYTRASWHGDSQGSINPRDEVAAYRDAIDARLMTHERAEWELFGTDWSRTFPTKVSEFDRMRAADILPATKAGAAASPTSA